MKRSFRAGAPQPLFSSGGFSIAYFQKFESSTLQEIQNCSCITMQFVANFATSEA